MDFKVNLTTVKQGKATTVKDRSRKCFTEERQILNRWTEYCSELYNYKASEDTSVVNCPQTDTEDDHPILRREVESAVHSLKKGKSSRWRGCNHCCHNKLQQDLANRRMANPMDPVFSHHTSQERQPAAVPELPNNQPHQSPKQSHAEDLTEQIEATSGQDHR